MKDLPMDFLPPTTEQLLTLHEASATLGLHYWQLQRAVQRGDIPSYTPFNSRRLVKLFRADRLY